MQAVLNVLIKVSKEESKEVPLLFDTETATKVCDIENAFGYAIETIYISPGGWLFVQNNNNKTLYVGDQKELKSYIGLNYPKRYQEIFGKVKEA